MHIFGYIDRIVPTQVDHTHNMYLYQNVIFLPEYLFFLYTRALGAKDEHNTHLLLILIPMMRNGYFSYYSVCSQQVYLAIQERVRFDAQMCT